MKFNLSTFTQGTNWGWVIAMTVVGPLLLWGFNALFMGGNKEAGKYAQRYIQESDTLIVSLDCDYKYKSTSIQTSVSRGGSGSLSHTAYTFYSNKYKKYMCIYTFSSFNIQRLYKKDGSGSYTLDVEYYPEYRNGFIGFLRGEKLVSFRVNRKQWNDPTYGTKENPMPIFWMKALSDYQSAESYIAIVSDEVNEKFVECYLKFLLPKEEFKRLYGNDLKNE